MQDFTYAARTLSKSPVFTITAAMTIALGIGASTAIFSVTHAVLLRPLPYRNPDRLVLAWKDYAKPHRRSLPFNNGEFFDLRDGASAVFDDMGAVFTFRVILPREDGTPERIYKAQVTTNFFRLMGARIAFGRDFTADDGLPQPQREALPPVGRVAILSYEYWQRRYGGNVGVIGHELMSPGRRGPEIVGVLAPGFELFFPASAATEAKPDVWIANNLGYDRGPAGLRVIGRL
jgi:putative ABC transport system permease protein